MRLFSGINSATAREAAARYIENGLHPVPVPYRQKKPVLTGWPKLRLSQTDVAQHFNATAQNIGIILGGDSGICDVDCDTPEATVAASVILPPTGMVFGRASKRASHYFYFAAPAMPIVTFKDPADKNMLVEFRCLKKDGGIGLQTIVPPSIHKDTGEKIDFEPGGDGEPAMVDAELLLRAVMHVAAAALLARHWPLQGSRHDAMLALAGALWRAGWPKDAAKQFCRAVYRAIQTHDPTAINRSDTEVEDSYRRGADGVEVTGQPTLAKILGDVVVATAMGWLSSPEAATVAPTMSITSSSAAEQGGESLNENPDDKSDREPGHPYGEKDGGIVRRKITRKSDGTVEETIIPLTNFTARITADVSEDDGVETKRHFEIHAKVGQTKTALVIPASQFVAMEWPIAHLGPRAIVQPNQRDWARTGIQSLSTKIESKRVYTYTGWCEEGGQRLYLHGGGAIGASGIVTTIDVRLPGALSRYQIKLPSDRAALIVAVNASLNVVETAPCHITFPLLAAVYRAAIKACDFGLWLAGPTGMFKSELAALAQQHYGLGMDSRHLPGNFASTGNALEMLAFHAKDTLLTIDDFAPHGGMQDVARYHAAAERILRAAGNSQGRGRLDSTAKLRDAKAPRGLILATGEDMPRGQSIRGRTFLVEVGPGDVSTKVLTDNQRAAAAGLYAQAMGAFIQYVATNYERIQREFQEAVLAARSRVTKVHARTPGIVADLQAGFELFLKFAVSVGAITVGRAEELKERCWKALNSVARAQRAPQDASEPARRFMDLFGGALTAGAAHVASMDGDRPIESAVAWGWREEEGGRERKWVAKGRCAGWTDGDNLYLEATAAYTIVQDFGRGTGEPLAVSQTALVKRLKEKGLLASVDVTRQTNYVRKTILGVQKNVLHLKASAVLGDVGFFEPDVGPLSENSPEPDNSSPNRINDLRGNVRFVRSIQGRDGAGESAGGASKLDGDTEVVTL